MAGLHSPPEQGVLSFSRCIGPPFKVMAPTTPTLPATIPGLLRRGSPVVLMSPYPGLPPNARGVCSRDGLVAWDDGPLLKVHLIDLGLDLTDATGRVHAGWWLRANKTPYLGTFTEGAILQAVRGEAMTEEEIAYLMLGCLAAERRS